MIRPRESAETLLCDAAVLAVSHVSNTTRTLQPWSESDGRRICRQAAHLLVRSSDAANVLGPHAARLAGEIDLISVLGAEGGPFGPAWSGHPFISSAMNVGYKLREADLTRELASLMGPSSGRRGPERAHSFLRVLADLTKRPTIASGIDARTSVSAEVPVVASRRRRQPEDGTSASETVRASTPRIDLLFEWPTGTANQRAVVVIEAKLGATVSDGQLKPYREEALRRAKGGPLGLVLLTARADKAERRHSSWLPVRWFSLMRRWENDLAAAGDDDPEFARVRAHVWQYILTSGGVFS